MNTPDETELFGRALQSHAQDAPPPAAEMASAAYGRARRIQRRRRVTASVACVAALAVAAPVGWTTLARDSGKDSQVTATIETKPPAPTPTRSTLPVFKRVELDFGKLPSQPAPLSYWEASSKTIRESDISFRFAPQPIQLSRVDAGGTPAYAAIVPDPTQVGGALEEHRQLVLVDVDAKPQQIGRSVGWKLAVSADRQRFAWTTSKREKDPSTLMLREATSGTVTEVALSKPAEVVGFLGDRVLLQGSGDRKPFLVEPVTGKSTPVDAVAAFATAQRTGLAGLATRLDDNDPTGNGRYCSAVVEYPSERQLWESCELTPVTFSPDGSYLVTQPSDTEGAGPTSYTIVDARTGARVLEIRAEWLSTVSWSEQGDQVVVEALAGGRFAAAACRLDGTCATVTKPRPHEGPGAAENPYVITSD